MLLIAVLFVLPFSGLALDCTTLADGDYEIGCKNYATCANGQLLIHECGVGLVYNRNTHKCDDPRNVPPPCNEANHCSTQPDGRYAIVHSPVNCTSYYTCMGGRLLGVNLCTPGTVFNNLLQTCDWPDDVAPPCGTKY
ncbi:hypothetical protein CHS0354_031608 [Potamilus streckersoni]|uniref:Chitin-binding type-2 domain-containing protein n=1 Tax=Potamilus streckersoni TaxID=2493646 RepID=A0AAE0SGD1_9BIVA|nr:hypothetical protein CHS0354_031608 [Potamilus streckersoni]